MDLKQLLNDTIKNVVKNRSQAKSVEIFRMFIEQNGWSIAIPKEPIYKGIDNLIKSKIEVEPETSLLDMLLGIERKAPRLTDHQKRMLLKIKTIIQEAKKSSCDHKIKISAFVHGGGFCMPHPNIELICEHCGLNVTVGRVKAEKLKEIGLKVNQKKLDSINKWADECFKSRKLPFANDITRDPFKALKSSEIWLNKSPFRIIDLKKFEARSGQ